MPNIVTPVLDNIDGTELKKAKAAMPEDFSGVLRYSTVEDPNTAIDEFYRGGTYIVLIETVRPKDPFKGDVKVFYFDANNEPIEPRNSKLHFTEQEVHFLKTLADSDTELAELITTT